MALAGYECWEKIAHISIVTAPEGRNRRFGGAAVSLAAKHALAADLVPQYRTLKGNEPSMRLAKRLGFEAYGVSTYVRISSSQSD